MTEMSQQRKTGNDNVIVGYRVSGID